MSDERALLEAMIIYDGAMELARSRNRASLKRLDMRHNFIGRRGAAALRGAFGKRCTLR